MTRALEEPALAMPAGRDDLRWAATLAKDCSRDGQFYYAVATTGVYCRPSCPARRPARANVRFYDTPAGAEAAGFRPCRRCRPDRPAPGERLAAAVTAACRRIETSEIAPKLAELAQSAGLSPSHFHRLFKTSTGLTPKAYAAALRHERIRDGLTRAASVTAAIFEAGFQSSGRFYAKSAQALGMKPARFRNGGASEEIRFAIGECSLGAVLAAATPTGVCAVFLGDDPDGLARELQDRFPRAKLIGADAEFERVVARVIGLVEEPATAFDLPLDIRGTAFQQRVWDALREISPGTTATYAEVARRIGAPAAVRAVAQACAANKVAVAIPCHRVVRSDGSLSGYRWGVERKRALLAKEAKP